MTRIATFLFLYIILNLSLNPLVAQPKVDTVNVMAYNILNYGDGCQGPLANLNSYFITILKYANPDVLSLEKISSSDTSALNRK